MASISEKYRTITAIGFLLFYLAGTFQSPVMEALHCLSHWNQKAQQHHFHQHADEGYSHHHSILELAGNLLAPFSDEPAPATDKADKLKKQFAECPQAPFQLALLLEEGLPERIHCPAQPYFFYSSVPTPPPRRV